MSKKLIDRIKLNATVDPNMPDFSNDPYFVKKNEKAEANLKKWGLPDAIKNRRK